MRKDSGQRMFCQYGEVHTLAETGKLLGISRERVRQIERRALAKLRRALERQGIRGVMDAL